MRRLIVSFIVSFFSYFPGSFATNIEPDFHWGEMLYYAQGRLDFHQAICQKLLDSKIDMSERVRVVKTIYPKLEESKVPVSQKLSRTAQQQMQARKFVEGCMADMVYGLLYWNFLTQTIKSCCDDPSTENARKNAILPHLVRELINFDGFASNDLINYIDTKYHQEEFFIGRAILEECDSLAKYYGISIDHPAYFKSKKTQETVSISHAQEFVSSGGKIHREGPVTKASHQLPYFMELLIFHRNKCMAYSAQLEPLPDLKTDPKLQIFQTYILPESGPCLIEVLQQTRGTTHVAPEKLLSQNGLAQPQKANDAPKKVRKKRKAPSVPTQNKPGQAKSEEPKPPLPQKPVITLVKRFDIREVRMHIEQRHSRSYTFKNQTYTLPFFEASLKNYETPFLKNIKELIHLSPKTDKLPNVAQGCITLHCEVAGQDAHKTITFRELFLSGGKFFGRDGFSFKKRHNIVTANPDLLTAAEQEHICGLALNKKGIPLGIAMEKKLRRYVAGGPWRSNCVDSEALFLLHVIYQLSSILEKLNADYPEQSVNLVGVVLGLSSYRDCCPNCEKLIHGFQWNLKDALLRSKPQQIQVDPNFATLAITMGDIRPTYQNEAVTRKTLSGHASLEVKKHKLICTQSNR